MLVRTRRREKEGIVHSERELLCLCVNPVISKIEEEEYRRIAKKTLDPALYSLWTRYDPFGEWLLVARDKL